MKRFLVGVERSPLLEGWPAWLPHLWHYLPTSPATDSLADGTDVTGACLSLVFASHPPLTCPLMSLAGPFFHLSPTVAVSCMFL